MIFHLQENILIYRQEFDLKGQVQELGSVSNVKELFNHTKADIRIKNFFANESLVKVTTAINLISVLSQQLGLVSSQQSPVSH